MISASLFWENAVGGAKVQSYGPQIFSYHLESISMVIVHLVLDALYKSDELSN